jgi:hypothetical protein
LLAYSCKTRYFDRLAVDEKTAWMLHSLTA